MRWLIRRDHLGSPLRVAIWFASAHRQRRLLKKLRPPLGYPAGEASLGSMSVGASEKKTLFVLGSGNSVNELGPDQFAEIDANFSIGINVWVAHHFVPNMYSLEGGGFPVSLEEQTHRQFLTDELNLRSKCEKAPGVIQLAPRHPHIPTQIVSVAGETLTRSTLVGRVNLTKAASLRGLDRDLRAILRGFRAGLVPDGILPDCGATVVRLIFLGFQRGFRRIVLVGVDLGDSPYFWCSDHQSPGFEKLRELFPRPAATEHDTMSTDNRPYSAKDFILRLSNELRRGYGVEVCVGSEASSLSAHLGVFPWASESS